MNKNEKISRVLARFPKVQPARNPLAGVNRNGPCPCGSGRKWKRCCLDQEQDARRLAMMAQDSEQQALRDELIRRESEDIERIKQ